MTGEQITYAQREGYRVVVTEDMVIDAMGKLSPPFTCHDIAEAIPGDDNGSLVSEYLVALWVDDLVRRGRLRWTERWQVRIGKPSRNLYEVVP